MVTMKELPQTYIDNIDSPNIMHNGDLASADSTQVLCFGLPVTVALQATCKLLKMNKGCRSTKLFVPQNG